MMSRIGFAALFCGACSGAHLPPVPVSPSSPASVSSLRPWNCSTPVGALVVELPEAHGLPLVGVSVVIQVGPQRVTVACEAPRVVEIPSAAPTEAPAPAPESAP
jgi:hypothetical protein